MPELAPGQALVRNELMSLDPSTRGRMDATDKVYTTNFEVGGPLDGWAIGRVVESRSAALPVGATVRHRLGWRELGRRRRHRGAAVDLSVAPAASWLSALGQTGFTAYVGPHAHRCTGRRRDGLRLGRRRRGADRSPASCPAARCRAGHRLRRWREKCRWLTERLGFDAAIDYRAEDVRSRLAELAPDGIDLYFDNVGGEQLVAALHNMRPGGRVALCGMVSTMRRRRDAQPPHRRS